MKQLFYIFMAMLLGACVKEDSRIENPDQDGMVRVSFAVEIPTAQPIVTRAFDENLITDLQLLVFDQNGRFISRHQALHGGSNFVVTLAQSSNKRIVHFIANYNWAGFNDAAYVNKDEGEVIAPLQLSSLGFWQRLVLDDGINANVFTLQPVSLIRNMAKFSLENRPLSGLTNAQFMLFNTASVGSVAPFNTANKAFESVVTEPSGVAFTGSSTLGVADVYVFERKNSTVTTNPTYVIVQGSYAGSIYYYKIDIIDPAKNMYDIQRNVWYKIIIESVTMAGYSTLDAAKSSPASNNISASVLLQSYPTISDGSYVLSVNRTIIAFTSNGQTLNANATYKTVAGVDQNSSIVVTLIQDPNLPVVNGAVTYNAATGSLTASINDVPLAGVARMATIKIEAGVLSRTIRLMLHAPFTFVGVSLTPSVVGNTGDAPCTLQFSVPAEAQYLLPFNCYITSAYLTPDFGNIEVVYENGVYKYKWKVTAVGVQTINFKTNTNNASETLSIDANLFERAQIAYSNTNNVSRFSNVVLTPNPVDFGIGKAVKLRFTVPKVGVYNIYTSNLTPTSGVVVGGIYTHTATVAGEQTINFVTNKQNSNEAIKLTGVNYQDYTISLRNKLVNISGKLTYRNPLTVISGGTVVVWVGSKVVGTIVTNSSGVYQASIAVNIGDILTFKYLSSSITYSTTSVVTSDLMTITKTLL